MQTVTSKDGTTIAYDQSGAGPAVILVSGALSERMAARPLAAALAPHFTVIGYDRRGRGESGDTPPYAVAREVEDIEALLGVAGGSAFVFGHSSGAALALEAANTGAAIARLALYEPPFIVDDARPPMSHDTLARATELLDSGRSGEAVELFMTNAEIPPAAIAGMKQSPMWAAMEKMAPTIPYDLMIMEGTEYGQPLPAERTEGVSIPTLVMAGGASPQWMRNAAEATTAAIPGARYRELPGQTHGADPQMVAAALAEFFLG